VPAAPRLGVGEKRRGVGTQHFQLGALRRRHIRGEPQGLERRALLRVLVEAERPAAAGHHREPLHAGHHAPEQRDIAIQVSRRLAYYHVQLGTAATIHIVVPPGAHHAVAVHQPGAADRRIGGDRKGIHESDFRRIGIRIRKPRDRETPQRALELGAHGAVRCADGLLAVRVAPLHDVVVLGAHDPQPVEVMPARQRLDIRDVVRGELRSELDDDAPGGQLQVQRVRGVERSPVRGSGSGQYVRAGERLLQRFARGGRAVQRRAREQQRNGQSRAHRARAHGSRSSQ